MPFFWAVIIGELIDAHALGTNKAPGFVDRAFFQAAIFPGRRAVLKRLINGSIRGRADQTHASPRRSGRPLRGIAQSRGTVSLRSNNPQDLAVLRPNYLQSEADLDLLIRGIELSRELVNTRAFDEFRGEELAPGISVTSKAELSAYVRQVASTVWHPVGTCKMGSDRDAVVNARLQVYGVEGLRVADASIMPTITSGNTNAPTIAIGEKAADLIIATR